MGSTAPVASAAGVKKHALWSPRPLAKTASSPGSAEKSAAHGVPVLQQPTTPSAPPVAWPAAGSGTVDTAAAPQGAKAGSTPVWVAAPGAAAAERSTRSAPSATAAAPDASAPEVSVQVGTQAQAQAAGVSGVIVSVSRADGGASPSEVSIGIDDSGFAKGLGGTFAAREHWVQLPSCALTTPGVPACRVQTPIDTTRDATTKRVQATVTVPAVTQSPPSGLRTVTGNATPAAFATATAPAAAKVLALAAAPSGSAGSYLATSLKPSDSWGSGTSAGDFTYDYPIAVPSALGGAAPTVDLAYDSADADGQTAADNNQTGPMGQGWSYSPGFIERSYLPCSQDGQKYSPDLCYGKQNVSLSLPGHSGQLVLDDTNNVWKIQGDDGSQIRDLTGDPFGANGDHDNEYWVVTATDGTKYYFGAGHLPSGVNQGPASNSVWTEPVYGADAGTPCHASTFLASACTKAWRWNLDYVVDTHGNLTSYQYTPETNSFTSGYTDAANGTLTSYVRGGYLNSISYGRSLAEAAAGKQASAQVQFTMSERCLAGTTACQPGNLTRANAANWPDVPIDQVCSTTVNNPCGDYSPSFFSTKMLTGISTQVLVGSGYQSVDGYKFTYQFLNPDQGLPSTTDFYQVLWLNSIQHVGSDGTSALAPSTFAPVELPNRVAGVTSGGQTLPAFYHPRIAQVTDELGAHTAVQYNLPQCNNNGAAGSVVMPSSAGSNTLLCYQETWTPPGQSAAIADWFNKFTVKSVTTDAGSSGLTGSSGTSSPAHVTSYTYNGTPAWHSNDDDPSYTGGAAVWDQYRGFGSVTTGTGTAPDPVTSTVTTYLRGMDQDLTGAGTSPGVTVTDGFGDQVVDDVALAGTVLETDVYNGPTLVSKTASVPWLSAPTAQHSRAANLPMLRARMHGVATSRKGSLLANGTWRTAVTNIGYDAQGRQITVDDPGDGTTPETCTKTTYATSAANPQWQNFPFDQLTVTGNCATAPSTTTTLSESRTFYGTTTAPPTGAASAEMGAGNPPDVTFVQVLDHYDAGGLPVYVTTSASTYDGYGRAVQVTDPANGAVTKTAYSPATGTLPTSVTVTNPMGWSSTTVLDPRRNVPTHKTDANGRVTDETYDAFGRLSAVWGPGRSMSTQTPSAKFSYTIPANASAPVTVETDQLREDGSYAASYTYYDALMQQIETQKHSSDDTGWLFSQTFYDSHGWPIRSLPAVYNSDTTTKAGQPLSFMDNNVPSSNTTTYDALGRPTAVKQFSKANFQWQTTTSYPGADETDVTPPAGGTPSTAITDLRGHTVQSWVYKTPTATGKSSDADVTSYSYDAAGRRSKVVDATGQNTWSYSYDLRGRLTSQSDPDAGTSQTYYNAAGQVDHTADARGQQLYFTYDLLGRKTSELANSATGPVQASWSYDTVPGALGLMAGSTRYSGGSAYTEAVNGYSTNYKPTSTTVTIPNSGQDAALAGSYTTVQNYTPVTEQLDHTDYPAAGPLPAESIFYSYSPNGLLQSAGGNGDYVTGMSYDAWGDPVRTTLGDMPLQAVQTTVFDPATGRRMSDVFDRENSTTGPVDTVSYLYDQAGKLTSASDTLGDAGNPVDNQCYAYDYAGQLSAAWTDKRADSTASTSNPTYSVPNVGTCANSGSAPSQSDAAAGNLAAGPAPYWHTYSYDVVGDRTSDVNHDVNGVTGNDVTRSYSYPAPGSPQPNASTGTTTSGPSGTSTDSYQYDAAGNTTVRKIGTTNNQTVTYDAEGRLAAVADQTTGQNTSYLYDADGSLLIQRDPTDVTLYLAGQELHLNPATQAKVGKRFIQSPSGAQVIESSAGTIDYEFTTAQGTGTLDLDAATLKYQRRFYDPYGNQRGTGPASWPDAHGYLGRPQDTSTGLDLLGARQYDPAVGRFLSADPVFEAGDPGQMGGYSYAGDDPVNSSDASGLCARFDERGPCVTSTTLANGSASASDQKTGEESSAGFDASKGTWYSLETPKQIQSHPAGDPSFQKWTQTTTSWFGSPAAAMAAAAAEKRKEAAAAAAAASAAKAKQHHGFWGAISGAADFVYHASGAADVVGCVTDPSIGGCVQAAITVGMVVGTGGESIVAEGAMTFGTDLLEEGLVNGAEDLGTQAAEDVGTEAADLGESCELHSFAGDTPVLMADGTTKPISQIKAGDQITNAAPGAADQKHTVDVVHTTYTDTDFTALTVATPSGPKTITTTQNHPFYDTTSGQFTGAGHLQAGEQLQTVDDGRVTVLAVRNYTGSMVTYDLTVDGMHTYYVEAGDTPVLVHNCGVAPEAHYEPSPEEAQDIIENAPRGSSAATKSDAYHRAADWVTDRIGSEGKVWRQAQRDPMNPDTPMHASVPGEVNGKAGRFHWIVDRTGTLTHSAFEPGNF